MKLVQGHNFAKLALETNTLVSIADTAFSKYEYGPVLAIASWKAECEGPLYLLLNFSLAPEALWYYKKRFNIETFFSDTKSRGFRLDKSHLKEPQRLERLLQVACLAYLWIVYLGTVAMVEGWNTLIHRTDRLGLSLFNLGLSLFNLGLSLFNLGLNLLEHFLNETMPLPTSFVPLHHEVFKSVR